MRRLFGRDRPSPAATGAAASGVLSGRPGFEYLADDEVYLDSACQTLRPQPVIDALTDYYTTHNACGDRVKYAWGRRVDEQVDATRDAVLAALDLPSRRYAASFTLNTTYGINLLLNQLPGGRYRRVVTTHTEHNSVFLSTMAYARRAGVERILLDRTPDGALVFSDADLADAVVVVSAMNNVDGAVTQGLPDLVARTRAAGGIVVVDAAQAFGHAPAVLRGLDADAVCFSAHKAYGASLGVVAASKALLMGLEVSFIGGGQVTGVTAHDYELYEEPHSRLEPGLQAWGEIIALGAALEWSGLTARRPDGARQEREGELAAFLFDGLSALPNLRVLSKRGSALVTVLPERVDGHRLATFLSKAGIMVRSGHFCAHHWLIEQQKLPPLVRFSLGAHNTAADVEKAVATMAPLMKGL